MDVLVKTLSGATPSTGDLPAVIRDGQVYITLNRFEDLWALARTCGYDVAIRCGEGDYLLIIDDFYD